MLNWIYIQFNKDQFNLHCICEALIICCGTDVAHPKNKSFPLHLPLSHLKVHVLQQLGQPVSGLRYGVAFNVRSSAVKSRVKVSHAVDSWISSCDCMDWIIQLLARYRVNPGMPSDRSCQRSWTSAFGSKTPHRRCARRVADPWTILAKGLTGISWHQRSTISRLEALVPHLFWFVEWCLKRPQIEKSLKICPLQNPAPRIWHSTSPATGILELMKTCLVKAFNLSKIQVLSSSAE